MKCFITKPTKLDSKSWFNGFWWQSFDIIQDLPDNNNKKRHTPAVNRIEDESFTNKSLVFPSIIRPQFTIFSNKNHIDYFCSN